jgi:hypothetical protein
MVAGSPNVSSWAQSVRADDSGAAAVGATLLSSTGAVEGAAADRGLPNRHPCA